MAHFPVSSFLEEVSSFEKQDFEAAWNEAWSNDVSIDNDLFPLNDDSFSFDSMDFSFGNSNDDDPILSAAANHDFDYLLEGPCSPIMSGDTDNEVTSDFSNIQDEKLDDEDLENYPAKVHSYCQPPPAHPVAIEESEDFNSNEENISPKVHQVVSVRKSIRRRRQRRGNKRRTVSSDLDDEAAIFSNGKPKQ